METITTSLRIHPASYSTLKEIARKKGLKIANALDQAMKLWIARETNMMVKADLGNGIKPVSLDEITPELLIKSEIVEIEPLSDRFTRPQLAALAKMLCEIADKQGSTVIVKIKDEKNPLWLVEKNFNPEEAYWKIIENAANDETGIAAVKIGNKEMVLSTRFLVKFPATSF